MTEHIAPLLDARQVAKILRVSLPFIYKLADRGQLRAVRWDTQGIGQERIRTTVRFKQSDVIEFIENNIQKGRK